MPAAVVLLPRVYSKIEKSMSSDIQGGNILLSMFLNGPHLAATYPKFHPFDPLHQARVCLRM